MCFSVHDVLGYLASGMSYEEFMGDFPHTEREGIVAAIIEELACQLLIDQNHSRRLVARFETAFPG